MREALQAQQMVPPPPLPSPPDAPPSAAPSEIFVRAGIQRPNRLRGRRRSRCPPWRVTSPQAATEQGKAPAAGGDQAEQGAHASDLQTMLRRVQVGRARLRSDRT